MIREVLSSFGGFPPLHGTVLLHTAEGDVVFDMWIREPQLRIEARIAGARPWTWVVDGDRTNIDEPHLHAGMLLATDPRQALMWCEQPTAIGADAVLHRPVTGISCRDDRGSSTHWIDDATGIIIRGESHRDAIVGSWRFTELELDPVFPVTIFEVPSE